jgi:hypothetical protein
MKAAVLTHSLLLPACPPYLLRMRRMRKSLVGNAHIMTRSLRKLIVTPLKRKIHESLPISNCFDHLMSELPSLKTLGCGIPKLVSLFDLVKQVVQLADKHKLWKAGQLPDEEFSGLGEVEIKQLKRR